MEIQRDIFKQLLAWKNRPDRMPLILQGARQTGKTWVMNDFGKHNFEYVAHFNFDKNDELKQLFEGTKNIKESSINKSNN